MTGDRAKFEITSQCPHCYGKLELEVREKPNLVPRGRIPGHGNELIDLSLLCVTRGDDKAIPFLEEMLHWPAGPRESDGCWAKHWYHAVEASTSFAPFKAPVIEVTPEQRAVAEDSRAAYLELYRQRLKIDP